MEGLEGQHSEFEFRESEGGKEDWPWGRESTVSVTRPEAVNPALREL